MTKRKFLFYKNSKAEWYLTLPEWDGDPEDLQMVEGADKWLDLICNNASKVEVWMADESFENASILTLLHVREANLGGGGNYYLETYQDQKVELKLWFCNVTEFVFGCIPQRIYFAAKSPNQLTI
jgi:hypothetical protein